MTTVARFAIADGDLGTAQTVERITALIRENVALPLVRRTVTQIVTGINPADAFGQLYAIRDWMSEHIIFLRDPAGVELLHTPEWQLRTIQTDGAVHEDCDDAAILGGALAGAIGCRVVLVTVGFGSPESPFTHIWVSASPPGAADFCELDVTRPMQNLPLDLITRSKVYPVLT